MRNDISYRLNPTVTDAELNTLFGASWERYRASSFRGVHERSLAYVCAYLGLELVGYVNLAWDGETHAFVLDPTVLPRLRGNGIGRRLVREAVEAARRAGVTWVHVDYEPHLRGFYAGCGFVPTEAGLIRLENANEG